jgi:alpha-tubulin suppressor-like RCC1 family protein
MDHLPHTVRLGLLAFALLAACERSTGPQSTATYPAMQLASIAAGYDHTCGIGTDSLAYCWGSGNLGGAVADSACGAGLVCHAVPAPVAGGQRFKTLTVGVRLDCGLTAAGAAWCWGDVGGWDFITWSSTSPVAYAEPLRFTAIASGYSHTCGLDAQQQLWCWGANLNGELGIGVGGYDTEYTEEPLLAAGGAVFTSIVAGGKHTCAANEVGQLLCWGFNADGQLGSLAAEPGLVCPFGPCETHPQGVHGGWIYTAVSAGWHHTCGLTSGLLVCWGANGAGQLGASASSDVCPPVESPGEPCAPYPVYVDFPPGFGDAQVVSVAAGGDHTCALTSAGAAWCWGSNAHGQLGIGVAGDRATPTLVAADTVTFRALSAGNAHTCGIATNGDAWCWGGNAGGQLGDGTTTDRLQPVRVRRPSP